MPGMSQVSGSIPESGLRFLIDLCCIYLVVTFVHRLLSACTLKR